MRKRERERERERERRKERERKGPDEGNIASALTIWNTIYRQHRRSHPIR